MEGNASIDGSMPGFASLFRAPPGVSRALSECGCICIHYHDMHMQARSQSVVCGRIWDGKLN